MSSSDRSDEGKIIELLELEGKSKLFEDADFLPIRQSLYNVKTVIPEYDLDISQRTVWCRPYSLSDKACYFCTDSVNSGRITAIQGSLPDELFLGSLLALSVYPREDLLQNIIASKVDDFASYGVYTCRFYVNGEWVDVVTDTFIPCVRDENTEAILPAYSTSVNSSEMWISFIEKAYAKALGSYESIPKVKLFDVLMHLTGGTIQQLQIHTTVGSGGDIQRASKALDITMPGSVINFFNKHISNDSIIIVTPLDKTTLYTDKGNMDDMQSVDSANDDGKNILQEESKFNGDDAMMEDLSNKDALIDEYGFFLPNRIYSIIGTKDVHGFELVLLHNPWGAELRPWRGDWSDRSVEWDHFPEVLQDIENDNSIPWCRSNPNGYFWMNVQNFVQYFNSIHICKLFPNRKHSFYCIKGEWVDKLAGGALVTIRDRAVVAAEAAESRVISAQKSSAAAVIDGDASWFNNPQYRMHSRKSSIIYISLLPISTGSNMDMQYISLALTSVVKGVNNLSHIWDASLTDVVSIDKLDGLSRVKGQEVSIWAYAVDPQHYYHIVPHTLRRGLEGSFILRVYSSDPLTIEKVSPLYTTIVKSDWRKTSEIDTTGGSLYITNSDGSKKENTKWCQNPQFHLEVANPYAKEEIHLKIVLKKVDKPSKHEGKHHQSDRGSSHAGSNSEKTPDTTIGLVICKADSLEDGSTQTRKKQPRQTPMGELLPTKVSSLKVKRSMFGVEEKPAIKNDAGKTILRKVSTLAEGYVLQSSFTHKTDACIYYPKMPRSWMPNGLIITPCLSLHGVKGSFELEVYSSEPIILNQLPDAFSRTLAGEWTEATAGGSHLGLTVKKNPKFSFKFKSSNKSSIPARVRVTLTRHGTSWKSMCKKDTLGCMIGFYVYISTAGEMIQILDATYVPDESVSTPDAFVLEQLPQESEYIIVPATFAEQKVGSFVLSIITESEFSLHAVK